jgi:hypothetical protein
MHAANEGYWIIRGPKDQPLFVPYLNAAREEQDTILAFREHARVEEYIHFHSVSHDRAPAEVGEPMFFSQWEFAETLRRLLQFRHFAVDHQPGSQSPHPRVSVFHYLRCIERGESSADAERLATSDSF